LLRSIYGIIFGTLIAIIALVVIRISKSYSLAKETGSKENVTSKSNIEEDNKSK
jgi:hypothetical protein